MGRFVRLFSFTLGVRFDDRGRTWAAQSGCLVWRQHRGRRMGPHSRHGRTVRRDAQVRVSDDLWSRKCPDERIRRYYYAEPVVLVGEIDGTRIVSQDAHELLQIVPREPVI